MNGFWAVFKRELKAYFSTPVAYVFLVIFLFFAGYLPFREGFFELRQADLNLFFQILPLLFIFMVPSTAMRLWAEERRTGSIELLLTLPITVPQAVLGKFFAAWAFLAIALVLTFPLPAAVFYLGEPDPGLIIAGYLASFLMAGGFLAIGSFFSALTKNQVVSFILSVAACGILVYAGMPSTLEYLSDMLPDSVLSVIESLSIQIHYDSLRRGVIAAADVAYFLILIAAWIYASMFVVEERKAS
ncbi:MAG TPA: ABC transporter permease [Anaerohalosphaeraceae bacterium]|nr:ABC transporter permease [Anaerohalosphaeraceae bacterium]HPB93008.1 ABC transporter permease [Anaerohalosphaeraceae bacterium]HRT23296.1 ABC transporter permease [Anaerohalosphaeraceae bacterium]